MVLIIESEEYFELEAIWLRNRSQGLQCDCCEVEVKMQSLHSVPWHGQVVVQHPLLAIVEGLRLFLRQLDTVHDELVVNLKMKIPTDVASLVMLNTKLETGVSKEWSQSVSFNLPPTLDHKVHKLKELGSSIHGKFPRGRRVSVNLPHLIPVPVKINLKKTFRRKNLKT